MSERYTQTPSANNANAAAKPKVSGPPPIQTTTSRATYMPSMTNSPWAKLITFIMPQINVSPEENKA
jgi:hypothetical protein